MRASRDGADGIRRHDVSALARVRALGALTHLIEKVRLGRELGMTPRELAIWSLDQYGERGYHDEWIAVHGRGNVDQFVDDFIGGRSVLYDECQIVRRDGAVIELRSRIWYHEEVPEAFFYFDVTTDEFTEYVVNLAQDNARRVGIDLTIRHHAGIEHAEVRVAAVDPAPPPQPAAASGCSR